MDERALAWLTAIGGGSFFLGILTWVGKVIYEHRKQGIKAGTIKTADSIKERKSLHDMELESDDVTIGHLERLLEKSVAQAEKDRTYFIGRVDQIMLDLTQSRDRELNCAKELAAVNTKCSFFEKWNEKLKADMDKQLDNIAALKNESMEYNTKLGTQTLIIESLKTEITDLRSEIRGMIETKSMTVTKL